MPRQRRVARENSTLDGNRARLERNRGARMKRKVILKRRPRVKVLQKKLEAIDRERAMLARIAPKPEELVPRKMLPYVTQEQLETLAESALIDKIVPQPKPHLASDFEFWSLYRQRFMAEEEKNARNIAPRGDVVETLLAQQMAALHRKCMDYVGREGLGEQDAMNFALRCMRVFSGQVEALKLWRSKGAQTMTVKHVNVNVGGQAIMGEITTSPRGGENFEQ